MNPAVCQLDRDRMEDLGLIDDDHIDDGPQAQHVEAVMPS
jgi:hypothetical protein